jgi:hypothetical protein
MTSVGANGAAFSYPIAGNENVGRIVYSDGGTVNAMDIMVNHADNTIVLGSPVPLFDSLNVADHELSPDGATVYFGKSADSPENFAGLYRHAIGDTQPPQQIYRGMTPGAGLYTASVSADGFTLVVEEVASFPERHRLLRIALPCSDSAACTTILDETSSSAWPAVHPFNSLVAYSDYLVGFNNCLQLRFLDSATGAATFAGTQPRYGTASSWFGNQILVNGRKPPDRKGACRESGVVTLVDPATGAETPLVSGYGPDGR